MGSQVKLFEIPLKETVNEFVEVIDELINQIEKYNIDAKIAAINQVRLRLHEISPFRNEPVDCVVWVNNDMVVANDYNPNKVAPPEMELLKCSIETDGYTQPIVAYKNEEKYEVVDGFHRNRVGREYRVVRERTFGFLPLAVINKDSEDRNNRIAATIRHNRARGKHTIEGMSDIVIELKNRNWTNERIAKNLGMDQDEILRLCQITGLAGLFQDQEFSKSWEIDDSEPDFEPLEEDDIGVNDDDKFRTVNTNDERRIFHTYEKWECYKAGFYNTTKEGMTSDECERAYCDFLSNTDEFKSALNHVINEWKYSCEHYLTNSGMNRIAWLGQAAMCYAKGIPSKYRGGFNLLSDKKQDEANEVALIYLNKWLTKNGMPEVSMEEALSNKQMELY
jgi:ParB-like chromosome segregation protein Spo0J